MLLRTLAYFAVGWFLAAAVAGLGQVFHLTVMLPATSAILLTHFAFTHHGATVAGIALGVALGYIEDHHQGAPLGTLTLAYALAYLCLRWGAARVALNNFLMRGLACAAAVLAVDVVTWAVLMVLGDRLELSRANHGISLWGVRWHLLATFLAAPPVWGAFERLLDFLRLSYRLPTNQGGT